MADNLGTGTSTVLDPQDLSYQLVVWQTQKPPTDTELNLVGQLGTEDRARHNKALMPSGFIGSSIGSRQAYYFHRSFTNYFYLGRQTEIETDTSSSATTGVKNIIWAHVNGWMIPITGTNVNNNLTLNNNDYRNKIVLPFAPTSGFKTHFVFLEVWKKLLSVNPSISGKPSATTIYKHGNVEFGGTNISDDLLRTDIGAETTKRVQLQYRIRVVDSVDAVSYPTGFEDTTNVYARANLSTGEAYTVSQSIDTSFYPVSGDEGLWRSGNGSSDNGLGTTDGYTYAIPICFVRRRNRGGWSISTTNGAVSRSTPPSGYVEGTPVSGVALTTDELNAAPDSDRPDGLYADYLLDEDIIDLRCHVSHSGHDYNAILSENVQALINNKLLTTPKYLSIGGVQYGPKYLVTDELNSSGSDNSSTILIGEPDGVRRIFSDVPVYQSKNLNVVAAASKEASSPSYGTDPDNWMPGDIISIPHPESLSSADYPSQFLTTETEITYEAGKLPIVSGFVTSATSNTLSSTSSFTTFYSHPTQWAGYAVVIVAGTGIGQTRTITTINNNDQISVSSNWSTTPTSSSSFIIRPPIIVATITADNTEMLVTLTSINGDTSSSSTSIRTANLTRNIWIEYVLHYPAGQGLSVRPDEIFRVNYTNPVSTVLRRPLITTSVNLLDIRSVEKSYDFINPSEINITDADNTIESECYVDAGSKTAIIQPYQRVNISLAPREQVTFTPGNSYYSLFDTRYSLEVPTSYLPSLGASSIPVIESAIGVFSTGLNVWAISESDASLAVIINTLGRSSFSDDTFVGNYVLALQDDITYEALDSGSPNKIGCRINPNVGGIELPQYIGLSRVVGIFEKADFNTNELAGTNLLSYSIEGTLIAPNIWIGRTTGHTDVTFTILPGAITNYNSGTEYVIVANLFGFREGFITENGLIAAHEQVTDTDESVTLSLVLTRPLPSSAVVQVTYNRTPYQGSIYHRYEPFGSSTPESFNNRGLVSPSDLANLNDSLTSHTLGSTFHFEVLAVTELFTTLGTGRFSGRATSRFYHKEGVNTPSGTPRHELLPLSDSGQSSSGFITRLPLGAKYRDADFVGEDLRSGSGKGNLIFLNTNTNTNSVAGSSLKDEVTLDAGSVITLTEGNTATGVLTRYRVTRGGSGFLQSTNPGGALSTGNKDLRIGYRGLYVLAMLVRNFEENGPQNFEIAENEDTNPSVLKGRAGELQLVLLTQAIDEAFSSQNIYANQTMSCQISAGGLGEGYAAIDRYRCIGRPLEHQHRLLPWEDDSSVVETPDIIRVRQPYVFDVWPSVVADTDAITLTGVNLSAVKSDGKGNGVEIFVRERIDGPSGSWTSVHADVISHSDTSITFRSRPVRGYYDILVRGGDGKNQIIEKAFTIGTSVSGVTKVEMVENFLEYEIGSFPYTTSGSNPGWVSNQPRAFRITDQDAYIGGRCGLFTGTGRSSSDIVRMSIPTGIGSLDDLIKIRYAFKLLSTTISAGNTFYIKIQDNQNVDLLVLTFTVSSSFFTLTAKDQLTGSGDVPLATSIAIDTEWHTVLMDIADDGSTIITFDDTDLVNGVIYEGTALINNYSFGRIVLQNDVASDVTSFDCMIDGISIVTY